jgi:hypothetical protein
MALYVSISPHCLGRMPDGRPKPGALPGRRVGQDRSLSPLAGRPPPPAMARAFLLLGWAALAHGYGQYRDLRPRC